MTIEALLKIGCRGGLIALLVAATLGCFTKTADAEGNAVVVSDDTYFSRAARWQQMGGHLTVIDPNAPRVITMEPWHETVFMAADGEHTVGEFVAHMGSQYEGGTPAGLRAQIHGLVTVLVQEGVLRLHSQPRPLPPYFATDSQSQDPATTAAQMRADGLIK